MRLYIIRHGETDWNVIHRVQGTTGADLNEKGVALAEETAEGMREIPFDFCVTSPLLRARHTAEILTEGRDIPVLFDERIREISFGEWEGLICVGEDAQIPGERWAPFIKDPARYLPPEGGESFGDVIARTGEFFQEITQNPENEDKTILISTHGCALRALMHHVWQDDDYWHGGVPANCAVCIVDVKDKIPELIEADHLYYDAAKWGIPENGRITGYENK